MFGIVVSYLHGGMHLIKSIIIKEDYFKFIITSKIKLNDFINDLIIISFSYISIDCPCHNSDISCYRKRTNSF
jgi:hypothetical protein